MVRVTWGWDRVRVGVRLRVKHFFPFFVVRAVFRARFGQTKS